MHDVNIDITQRYSITAFGKTFVFTGSDIYDQLSEKSLHVSQQDFDEAQAYAIIEPLNGSVFTDDELDQIGSAFSSYEIKVL